MRHCPVISSQDWSGSPVLRVVDGRHPLLLAQSKDTLIPNDLVMGGDVFVLSGANMGEENKGLGLELTLHAVHHCFYSVSGFQGGSRQ